MNKEEVNKNSENQETKPEKKKKRTLLQKIVNVFLLAGIGLLILLLVFLGISQTSTFREFLREEIIEIANSSLNGTVSIEKIDGTIFTSVILRNTVVNIEKDTILKSELISIKVSPLQLLLKKIYVREIEISNAAINISSDSEGVLNISKLFPESEEVLDTTTSQFPFKIEVAELELKNIDFSFQDYNKIGSISFYDELNTDDLRIKNLNLSLSGEVDINRNNYKLALHHLSFNPNISGFNLKKLSGVFHISESGILVNQLSISTERSEVAINLQLSDFNLFAPDGADIGNAYINLEAGTNNFSFDDLKAVVPATDILNGNATFWLQAEGYLKELNINSLLVQLQDSKIEGKGKLINLDSPESLFIDVDLSNSYINQRDVNLLLPELEIPVYPEFGVIRFDSLKYQGEPLEFLSRVNITTDKGKLAAQLKLGLKKELMEYVLSLKTDKLDLSPFTGTPTDLNLTANIAGKGTSPAELDMKLDLTTYGSKYNGAGIDTLIISGSAENKNIVYTLNLFSDILQANLAGSFDFTEEENPLYKFTGSISSLDLAKLTNDTTFQTDLNFTIDAEGQDFNPDEMNLFVVLTFYNSVLNEITLDSTRAIVDMRGGNGEDRVINIISDLADITLTGDFSIVQAIDLVSSEAQLLSTAFTDKLSYLLPSLFPQSGDEMPAVLKTKPFFSETINPVNLSYVIELKDFSLLSVFIGESKIEVDGEMEGTVKSSADNVSLSFISKLNHIRYLSEEDILFVKNLNFELDVSNPFTAVSTYDIMLDVFASAERIFADSDIYDLDFSLNMNNDIAAINLAVKPEDLYIKFDGEIDISKNNIALNVDTFKIGYLNFLLENERKFGIVYTEDRIEINDLNLVHGNSIFSADGFLKDSGEQELKLSLSNFSGEDLSVNLLQLWPENNLGANINLIADVSGNIQQPRFSLEMSVDSVTFKERSFGSLKSILNYNDKNLDLDIKFTDSLFNPTEPALILTGNYPIDLSFASGNGDDAENKPMNIHMKSEGFNLGAFGDVLPAVKRLRGMLTSDLTITGTPADIYASGYLRVKDATFLLEANNMEYNTALVLRIEGEQLSIDSIMLANVRGAQFGGRMFGSGNAIFDNFNIVSSKFSIGGDLQVLSEASKSALPMVYGNLQIGTRGNIELEIDEERTFLKASLLIKRRPKLTFPQTQSAYRSGMETFVYRIIEDTSSEQEIDFETLIDLARQEQSGGVAAQKKSVFDFDLDIEVEDEMTVVFVLSREFNQNLTAVLNGNLKYSSYGGRTDAQGSMDLLEGSTLEFLKTLEAVGSIRFEGEIENPYLDIVATYRSFYLPLEGLDAGKQVEVAVGLNLEGPLKELNKRLIRPEGNFKVYYGIENIENNQPSAQYDASDAAMFILLDKFNDDADQQDRNAVASYAAGLAGSLVGGFLNNQLGDVIKGVDIRQVGSTTTVSILGRIDKFRYEIGTSTDGYQDLSKANVKIEYPVTRRFFLRLERKRPVTSQSTYTTEMINELGLKYRFEF